MASCICLFRRWNTGSAVAAMLLVFPTPRLVSFRFALFVVPEQWWKRFYGAMKLQTLYVR